MTKQPLSDTRKTSKPSDTLTDFSTEALDELGILVPETLQDYGILSPIVDHALTLRLDADELSLHVQAKIEMSHIFDVLTWERETQQKKPIL